MDYAPLYRYYLPDLREPNAAGEYAACCPFHADSRPSFYANARTGEWYCHACRVGGPPEAFVQRMERCSPEEARRRVAELLGLPQLPTEEQLREWHRRLLEAGTVVAYLRRRRVWDERLAERYLLGWDGERITIPIRDERGQLVNVRRLLTGGGSGPKVLNWPGHGAPRLWPLDQLQGARPGDLILVCEGELDALSAIIQGYRAVTCGGAGDWRDVFAPVFAGLDVAIVYDGDAAGRAGARKVVASLEGHARRVLVVRLPDGEDVNSLWQRGVHLESFIEQAQADAATGPAILTKAQLLAEAERERQRPWVVGGLVRAGRLVLLGGPPKAGKTTLAAHLMGAVLTGEPFLDRPTLPVPVLYLNYEMALDDLADLLTESIGDGPWPDVMRDPPVPLTPEGLERFLGEYDRPGIVVVDTASGAFGLTREQENSVEVGHVLRAYQRLARRTGWVVLVLHHTRKYAGRHEPDPEDLVGSREWVAAPDVVMVWAVPQEELEKAETEETGAVEGKLVVRGRIPPVRTASLLLSRRNLVLLGPSSEVENRRIQDEVAAYLSDKPGQTVTTIARELGLPRERVWKALVTGQGAVFIRRDEGRTHRWYAFKNGAVGGGE